MSDQKPVHKSEIKLDVHLDEQHLPVKILWQASDSGFPEAQECGAFMLCVWDRVKEETLRIDLWNKDMRKDEMNKFFFQSLLTMADTFQRANGDEPLSKEMREFALKFGEKTKLIKRL